MQQAIFITEEFLLVLLSHLPNSFLTCLDKRVADLVDRVTRISLTPVSVWLGI